MAAMGSWSAYGNDSSYNKKAEKYKVDLAPLLERFSKAGQKQDPALYEIRFVKGREHIHSRSEVYCDGQRTFLLLKKKDPNDELRKWWKAIIACISFNVYKEKRAVRIVQIQGVRGRRKDLKLLRWERLLVQLMVDWAKTKKLVRVEIQRAQDNKWQRQGAVSLESLKLRYNVTAERSGFKYDPKKKVYKLIFAKRSG